MANSVKIGGATFTEYPVGGGKRRLKIQDKGLRSITLDIASDDDAKQIAALITGKSSTGKSEKASAPADVAPPAKKAEDKADDKPDATKAKNSEKADVKPNAEKAEASAKADVVLPADGKAAAPKDNHKGDSKNKSAK